MNYYEKNPVIYICQLQPDAEIIFEDNNIPVDKVKSGYIVELRNLATVAKMIIVSAISRKESRGIHYNVDYPFKVKKVRPTTLKRPW